MGMDAYISNETADTNLKTSSNFILEALTNGENGIEESSMLMEMLTRLDIDLAYSSEKLANLDVYMEIVSLGECRLGESSMDVEIEKALTFDLSLGYLESEVTELKHFLIVLRGEIVDAHKQLHSLGQGSVTFTTFEGKLHAFEGSLKHLQEQLSGLERQLAITRGTPYGQINTFLSEDVNSERSVSDHQTTAQQRLVLRMLDKSLSRELDLENQLLDSKEQEEKLKSKLLHMNMVVSDLESFVDVSLENFLEVEHSSVVYMGIAKEMMIRLQISQFNINCSAQREEDLKFKLQSSFEKMKEKEREQLEKLNQSIREKEKFEEKVKVLEKNLCVSESKLEEVNGSFEASQEEISLMENMVESLREHILIAESRAQSAENKITTLTEENVELKEELTFLKDGDDNVEKISLLDKQVRDLEVQLQTAKISCEASLEQQNMLYTAIWDMETLIEELRDKFSRAESRADSAEKQCLDLAEINIKTNKVISYLKCESEKLKDILKEDNKVRIARVNDVYNGAKLLTEVVVKLAGERERIHEQLSALARENKILLEELRKMRKSGVKGLKADQDNKDSNVKNSGAIADDPYARATIVVSTAKEIKETPTSTTAINQVDQLAVQKIIEEAEASSSSTPDVVAKNVASDEIEKKINMHVKKKHYTFAAIIVLLLSILAMIIGWQDLASLILLITRQYLGFQ